MKTLPEKKTLGGYNVEVTHSVTWFVKKTKLFKIVITYAKDLFLLLTISRLSSMTLKAQEIKNLKGKIKKP